MSDINHNRMIPLHIADQAVANCEAEIQRLREENAHLKAEVERLRQDLVAVKYYGELLEFLKANAAKEGKQS